MDTEWFHPEFNPSEFRRAAARYVKLLIRARWKAEPKFLSQKELQSWDLANIDKESLEESWRLLRLAATDLATLNREYLPRCGSGGVAPTDEKSPLGRLIDDLSFLVNEDLYPSGGNRGGGPEHNSTLLNASGLLRRGESIKWDDLADWSRLPAIRRDLDQLPEPLKQPPEDHECYVFYFKGKVCHLAYGTPEVTAIPGAIKGLFYIWQLIKAAPNYVSAAKLIDAATRYYSPERYSSAAVEDEESVEAEYYSPSSSGRKPQSSSDFANDLSAEIMRLEASLENAKTSGDTKSVDVNTKELTNLRQTHRNQTWGGRTKPESSSKEKNARDAVMTCLGRGFDLIGKALPLLAIHLRDAIKTPDQFYYAHELAHPWKTQADDDRVVAKKR